MCEVCEKAKSIPGKFPDVLRLRMLHRICQTTPKTILVPGKAVEEYHRHPITQRASVEVRRFMYPVPNEQWEEVHRMEVRYRQELEQEVREYQKGHRNV